MFASASARLFKQSDIEPLDSGFENIVPVLGFKIHAELPADQMAVDAGSNDQRRAGPAFAIALEVSPGSNSSSQQVEAKRVPDRSIGLVPRNLFKATAACYGVPAHVQDTFH